MTADQTADELNIVLADAQRRRRSSVSISVRSLETILAGYTTQQGDVAALGSDLKTVRAALVHARRVASGQVPSRLFAD